jgi:DDE superfamily endonuclease
VFPLPLTDIVPVLLQFAPMFSDRVWPHAVLLVVGAILSPEKRTVTAALRVMGLADEKQFGKYHRVLSRAVWSSRELSRILLGLLISVLLSADSPLLIVVDETLERRQGAQIRAKGVFRDGVRSTKERVVTSFGLRWIAMMLVVQLPWAKRPWALPFLTVLAPSERANAKLQRRHKTVVKWTRQLIAQVRRWWPWRRIVLIGDGAYAAVGLALWCSGMLNPVTLVTRLRLDAALYAPPGERSPHRRGPKPKKGERLPALARRAADPDAAWERLTLTWYGGEPRTVLTQTGTALWYTPRFVPASMRWVLVRCPDGRFDDQAFLCTDLDATPTQILAWVVLRWNIEVTFEDVRAHLGVETQRQWSDKAIARTTPILLGLYSLITLLAHEWIAQQPLPVRTAAWYQKEDATFADAIAFVRRAIWGRLNCMRSTADPDWVLIPRRSAEQLMDTLCYAA